MLRIGLLQQDLLQIQNFQLLIFPFCHGASSSCEFLSYNLPYFLSKINTFFASCPIYRTPDMIY